MGAQSRLVDAGWNEGRCGHGLGGLVACRRNEACCIDGQSMLTACRWDEGFRMA